MAGLLAGIKIVQKEPELRQKLWSNVAFLRRRFAEEGVDIGKSNSQVMPVMVNNDARCLRWPKRSRTAASSCSP